MTHPHRLYASYVCVVDAIVTVDALFFFLLIALLHQTVDLLLLFGNKRDRLGTLTQCAEWSPFAIDYYYLII